jgi:hypothetical protein
MHDNSYALTRPQAKSLLLLLLLLLHHTKSLVMACDGFTSSIPKAATKSCLLLLFLVGMVSAQLTTTFYDKSCPRALSIVNSAIIAAVLKEPRMGASLLRLNFHDCFVQASHPISHFLLSLFFLAQYIYIYIYLLCKCLHAYVASNI